MAGYSGIPLPKKLGIKPDSRVALVDRPDEWSDLDEVDYACVVDDPPYDVILWFVTRRADLEAGFSDMAKRIVPRGRLWIAWPKKTSKAPTDLTEDILREVGLPLGMVDNKVSAVDEKWSGLQFVWRRESRPKE